jgi:hypothetical protein
MHGDPVYVSPNRGRGPMEILRPFARGRGREKKAELTEYKMASKLMSKRSFHLEKSRSATTATTNDCTVLNRH